MTKHTPGPWRFEAATKTIRAEPTNYWLATMDSWDGAVDHAANARLIAAAPDLLAALESFMRAPSIGSSGPGSVSIEVQTFNLDAARAAIAKARGES